MWILLNNFATWVAQKTKLNSIVPPEYYFYNLFFLHFYPASYVNKLSVVGVQFIVVLEESKNQCILWDKQIPFNHINLKYYWFVQHWSFPHMCTNSSRDT